MVFSLAVALLVGGGAISAALDDYPIVDSAIPAFGVEVSGRYVDDVPIVQDDIAAPWEPITPLPRCGCDGLAVPEGW
jgi:hypothetical protein